MKTDEGKKKKKGNRRLHWLLKLQFVLQLLVIIAIIFYLIFGPSIRKFSGTIRGLQKEADALVADVNEETFRTGQASTVYAADGTVISVLKGGKDTCYVPLSSMPKCVIDATVCMEDNRFYKHHGVDYKALIRAFFALVKNKGKVTQGGSTITMQLARTMYLNQEVSWQRKAQEIFIAQKLEEKFSKEQIMEFYLNNIYFGNGYYGIGTASKGYFGKGIEELRLSELIYLCAIPNNPTVYDPLQNGDNTEKRKNFILEKMLDEELISQKDYETAVSEKVTLAKPKALPKNDYQETYAAYCAVHELMKLFGFQFRYEFVDEGEQAEYDRLYADFYAACQRLLYTEGYRIYTSLDPGMQRKLQASVDLVLGDFTETNEEGVYTFQGASVCIDNETGFVKAVVGGRSQTFDFYPLNRAYQSYRQPGSSIKPLIVYTPAFERNYTPDSVVADAPIAGGPRNATGIFEGNVTVRHAVEESINTVAWKIFEQLSPAVGLSYLYRMEFGGIVAEDYGLASALGGLTKGVTPLEMASAYAAIENGGVFRSPTCIVRITDAEGRILYEPDRTGIRVYEEKAAATMEDVLRGVMLRGTARPVRLSGFCAGKTGTTNECKDSWFVGYTREYTTSVWVGYDMPREIAGLTGPAYSGFIWKDFMEKITPYE